MNPDLLLGVGTAVAGFLLKTTLAFALCVCLAWLSGSPGRRFVVWLSFLVGTAGYWLWLAKGLCVRSQFPTSAPGMPLIPARSVSSTTASLQIPSSWAFSLGVGLRVAGVAYLLFLGYILFSEIRKLRQLKWVLSFTSQPPQEIREAFQPLAESLHVGRSRLLVLSGVSSPATFGWIRPTIVLPEICLGQERSEVEDILRHELHHVRRLDFLWNGVALMCRALLCFHPAAWLAVRRMQFDRELACDLAVVTDSPKRRASYAESLIHFARLDSSQDARAWGIDFAAPAEDLKTRVHSILAMSKKPAAWLVWSRIVCGLALLGGFLTVEPSLKVLLTYAQEQIAQPVAPEVFAPSAKQQTREKAIRSRRQPAAGSPGGAVASLSPATQLEDLAGNRVTETSSPQPGLAPASAGPQLLHRGSSAATKSTKQTVVPINDPSGETTHGGDHDRKQAVQQTATAAAGIYKRLSVFDRR